MSKPSPDYIRGGEVMIDLIDEAMNLFFDEFPMCSRGNWEALVEGIRSGRE